jgi:hypothetical protein
MYDIEKRYRTRVESGEAFGSTSRKWHARKRMVSTDRVVKGLKNSLKMIQAHPLLLWGQI